MAISKPILSRPDGLDRLSRTHNSRKLPPARLYPKEDDRVKRDAPVHILSSPDAPDSLSGTNISRKISPPRLYPKDDDRAEGDAPLHILRRPDGPDSLSSTHKSRKLPPPRLYPKDDDRAKRDVPPQVPMSYIDESDSSAQDRALRCLRYLNRRERERARALKHEIKVKPNLHTLPVRILDRISYFCDYRDLIRLSRTSLSLNINVDTQIASEEGRSWRLATAERDFSPQSLQNFQDGFGCWSCFRLRPGSAISATGKGQVLQVEVTRGSLSPSVPDPGYFLPLSPPASPPHIYQKRDATPPTPTSSPTLSSHHCYQREEIQPSLPLTPIQSPVVPSSPSHDFEQENTYNRHDIPIKPCSTLLINLSDSITERNRKYAHTHADAPMHMERVVINIPRFCIPCGLMQGLHQPGQTIETITGEGRWICGCRRSHTMITNSSRRKQDSSGDERKRPRRYEQEEGEEEEEEDAGRDKGGQSHCVDCGMDQPSSSSASSSSSSQPRRGKRAKTLKTNLPLRER